MTLVNVSRFHPSIHPHPYLHLPALLLPLLGGLLGASGVDRLPERLVHLGPVLVRLVLRLARQLVTTNLERL